MFNTIRRMRGVFYCNMYKLGAKYTIESINDPYCWKEHRQWECVSLWRSKNFVITWFITRVPHSLVPRIWENFHSHLCWVTHAKWTILGSCTRNDPRFDIWQICWQICMLSFNTSLNKLRQICPTQGMRPASFSF